MPLKYACPFYILVLPLLLKQATQLQAGICSIKLRTCGHECLHILFLVLYSDRVEVGGECAVIITTKIVIKYVIEKILGTLPQPHTLYHVMWRHSTFKTFLCEKMLWDCLVSLFYFLALQKCSVIKGEKNCKKV